MTPGGSPRSTPVRRVLIANRGEIAVRIARACRSFGAESVAVFSDADAGALHVRAADHAIHIGPTPAGQSYLDLDRIIAAALDSGADALHPGYGFLSERPELPERCAAAGITFIGPSADAMRALGDKSSAKAVAARVGVPTVPTFDAGAVPDAAYPVLVKAAAGGGGRGMRIVRRPADLPEALASAQREAEAAFGSSELLVERLVEGGRHIEVQLLADAHGTTLAIGDRDCSLQRRHQKVVEEAPAPGLSDTVRQDLASATVRLAEAVGYVGAGTAEFLVSPDDEWFFLELNARLQVEHPVTELAFGLDLVQLQLLIASGEPMVIAQDDLEQRSYAIEARLYAEDPVTFLPTGGHLTALHLPTGAGIRVDSGLQDGQEISLAYDPLLAKVIASGPTREEARRRLVEALRRTAVLGVTTNGALLLHALQLPAFVAGRHTVATLEANPVDPAMLSPADAAVQAARTAVDGAASQDTVFAALGAWRGRPTSQPVAASNRHLCAAARGDLIVASDDGIGFEIQRDHVEVPAVARSNGGDAATIAALTSPMPGTVIRVLETGTVVAAGDAVVVLEAMKMENAVAAPFAGTVGQVGCAVGDLVAKGAVLAELAR